MKIHAILTALAGIMALTQPATADWEETPYGRYWQGDGKPEPVSALKGTFYDFRYKSNGTEQHPDIPKQPGTWWDLIVVRGVILKALNEACKGKKTEISKLFRHYGNLYASHFYIPCRNLECISKHLPEKRRAGIEVASEASDFITERPKEEKWLPGGWVAVYRGKVIAPKNGKFRFVGTADDCIIVRFANRMVLEAGYTVVSDIDFNNPDSIWDAVDKGASANYRQKIHQGKDSIHRQYELLRLKSTPKLNEKLGGFTAGAPFTVKKGTVYPIEVILMQAAHDSRFFLMIQELRKDGKLAPLQLFRTDDTQPGKEELTSPYEKPDFMENSLIWKTVQE